jgi:hypothetical protein
MERASGLPGDGLLVWNKVKVMGREYELKDGDEALGQMQFESAFGSLASAEVASQSFTLKREGFLSPRVTVRAPGSEANLVVFHPKWTGGGMAEFADGRQIQWRHTSFWGSEWSFLAEDNHALMRFQQHMGLLKFSAELAIEPADVALPEVPLLVALGWYLMILTAQDAAAAATVVAVH